MRRAVDSWPLFLALALLISAINCIGLAVVNLRTESGAVALILLAVRCALPLFLVAFTASSVARLYWGRGPRWLLANRRYFGLAFAFGMAWHLSFVGYSFARFDVHLNIRVLILDLIGLGFLVALTLTSFRGPARWIGPANWRRLHKTGVYFIWLLATFIYFEFARGDRDFFDCAALGLLLAAWLLRVAAWLKSKLAHRGRPQSVITG